MQVEFKKEKLYYKPGIVVNDDECQIIENPTEKADLNDNEDSNKQKGSGLYDNIIFQEPVRQKHGFKRILIDPDLPETYIPYLIKG